MCNEVSIFSIIQNQIYYATNFQNAKYKLLNQKLDNLNIPFEIINTGYDIFFIENALIKYV